MILVERTHWPLVVVGSVPDVDHIAEAAALADDARVWTGRSLRVALIIGGFGARARTAQEALVAWLSRHQDMLAARAIRFAWVIEDDTLRESAEAWQHLFGRVLFGVDAQIFAEVGPALRWLMQDGASHVTDAREHVSPAPWMVGDGEAGFLRPVAAQRYATG